MSNKADIKNIFDSFGDIENNGVSDTRKTIPTTGNIDIADSLNFSTNNLIFILLLYLEN